MIKRLQLQNFKCIKNEHFEFSALNILSGMNGSGKSTLCQSLLLVQKYLQTSKTIHLDKKFVMNIPDILVGNVKDILCEDAEIDSITIALEKHDSSDALVLDLDANDKERDYLVVRNNDEIRKNTLCDELEQIRYIKAERKGPVAIQEKNDGVVIDKLSLGSSGEYTYSYLEAHGSEVMQNIDSRDHKMSSNDSLIELVSCWLQEISPRVNIRTRDLDGTSYVNLFYTYTKGDGESNNYRAANVGFGITYCLPIITACIAATKGDIIIIDTPEAHLHPRAQIKLGELLAKTAADGIQVIVETHSDHIINGVRKSVIKEFVDADNVVFFHFGMNELENSTELRTSIEKPKLDQNGMFDNWPKGFFDDWSRSNIDLLELRESKEREN